MDTSQQPHESTCVTTIFQRILAVDLAHPPFSIIVQAIVHPTTMAAAPNPQPPSPAAIVTFTKNGQGLFGWRTIGIARYHMHAHIPCIPLRIMHACPRFGVNGLGKPTVVAVSEFASQGNGMFRQIHLLFAFKIR